MINMKPLPRRRRTAVASASSSAVASTVAGLHRCCLCICLLAVVIPGAPTALAFAAHSSGISMPPLTSIPDHLPLAKKCCNYLDSSPDPYHVVATTSQELERAGFEELDEAAPYADRIVPGGKYYFTKNRSTIVAFAVGKKYRPGNGFKIIGE